MELGLGILFIPQRLGRCPPALDVFLFEVLFPQATPVATAQVFLVVRDTVVVGGTSDVAC